MTVKTMCEKRRRQVAASSINVVGSTHYNVPILTRTQAVLKVNVPLLKGITEVKFLGNSSLPFVIQAMTAVTSIFALKAALWSVPLVFTEGAAVAIRTVTCLSFFLRT